MFGRMQLLRLLGKSERSMAWLVADPRTRQELMLVLPRVQPGDPAALERWQLGVRKASRLSHPNLAAVVDTGVQDGWPYAAYDIGDCATLADRRTTQGLPGAEAAALALQALQGLAFAHDAGVAHHDLQSFLLLVSDSGQLRIAGAAVAEGMVTAPEGETLDTGDAARSSPGTDGRDHSALGQHRQAAERDVLCCGVLMHGLLAGPPALDEPDVGRVVARMAPYCGTGAREIIRLPWTTAHPIAEPLRTIVNRATDRQARQRYRNARTLQRALEGWLQTEAGGSQDVLALLGDKLASAGVLPSQPGAAARAARLALMERERTNELADVVLQDLALSFELLRLVNAATVRGAQLSGNGPVLTLRRAIAMLGLDGVRRAALTLREWPGPLNETHAAQLERQIDRAKHAGRVALSLRPAGYDGEVVYLLSLLQNLGRLVVQYHFADEAAQIRRLMQAAPPAREGDAEEPGMSEEAAAFAVLGVDIEAIGAAVARHWGLEDSVLTMARRLPVATPVRTIEDDDSLLRAVASCANEAVDALQLPAPRVLVALQRVVQRYGRSLGLGLRELQEALKDRPDTAISGQAYTQPAPLDDGPAGHPGGQSPVLPAGLRAAASQRAAGADAHRQAGVDAVVPGDGWTLGHGQTPQRPHG
jgi:non-specific serine/threonine protein kinase